MWQRAWCGYKERQRIGALHAICLPCLGTVLGVGRASVNKADSNFCPWGAHYDDDEEEE